MAAVVGLQFYRQRWPFDLQLCPPITLPITPAHPASHAMHDGMQQRTDGGAVGLPEGYAAVTIDPARMADLQLATAVDAIRAAADKSEAGE